MTAHELARQLLDGPDFDLYVDSDDPCFVTDIRVIVEPEFTQVVISTNPRGES